MLLVTDFGSRCDLNASGTLGSGYGELAKLAVFAYSGQFCMLFVTDFGPAAIRTFWEPRGPVMGNSSKLAGFAYSGQFCMLFVSAFGSLRDPDVSGTSGSG